MKVPWIAPVLFIVPALALWLLPTYEAGSWPTLDFPINGARRYLAAWGLTCLGAGIFALARQTTWQKGLGMALMFTPAAFTLWAILNDLAPLLAGGKPISARTPYQLSTAYMRTILIDLGYTGTGFLLWSGWRPAHTIRDIAHRLRLAGFPLGHRSEVSSLLLGVGWFPVLLVGAVLINAATQGTALVNNDESSIWSLATPWHVIMISLAAAMGEETAYRGVLMVTLATVIGARSGKPSARYAWWAAIAIQGVFFGFAHAGFGNYAHVLQATLFGLVAGAAAYRFGIWSVIALHFLVDIYAIGADIDSRLWIATLVALLVLNTAYSVWSGTRWVRQRIHAA